MDIWREFFQANWLLCVANLTMSQHAAQILQGNGIQVVSVWHPRREERSYLKNISFLPNSSYQDHCCAILKIYSPLSLGIINKSFGDGLIGIYTTITKKRPMSAVAVGFFGINFVYDRFVFIM